MRLASNLSGGLMPNIQLVERDFIVRFYVQWDGRLIPVRYTAESGFDYDEDDLANIDGVAFADFLTDDVVIKSSINIRGDHD
jgi:hypothetical protein